MTSATELIRKKRDGNVLSRDEIAFLVDGYTRGSLPDYQMSAFLMACTIRGLNEAETHALTDVMLKSGSVLDLSDVPGVKVDKHSTGGVGDKVSIMLAPIVASCGVPVPMISGRGLGHTGGTLDKLESIPGFRTNLTVSEFRQVLRGCGAALIGQTDDLAPADRKLYALRDVTGTIECIPLIAGSIMSKKLASGIDALVLDVKTGNGAFMKNLDDALELAGTLVRIGEAAGKRTVAYVTDMHQPLGSSVGNWLEIRECVDCLSGNHDARTEDLLQLTLLLAGTMLWLGGAAPGVVEGITKAKSSVTDGRALKKLIEIVRLQGGDASVLDGSRTVAPARFRQQVTADRSGFLSRIDTESVGLSSVTLGAGRLKLGDPVDPSAGIVVQKKLSEEVSEGDTIAEIHTNRREAMPEAAARLRMAFEISETRPSATLPVLATVTINGTTLWTDSDHPVYPA